MAEETEEEFVPSEEVDGLEPLLRWEAPEETTGTVQHYTNEVIGLCPFYEGVTDHYDVYIRYKPDDWCVELKSLKFYFQEFEGQRISHERLCAKVFEDLNDLLEPEWVEVQTIVGRRGGIDTTVCHTNREEGESVVENDVLSQTVSRE